MFWKNLLLAGILRFFGDIIQFVGPWCIELIINYAYAQVKAKEGSTPINGSSTEVSSSNLSIPLIPYNSSVSSFNNQSITMMPPKMVKSFGENYDIQVSDIMQFNWPLNKIFGFQMILSFKIMEKLI